MSFDRLKAFEVSGERGYLMEDRIWISSGSGSPSHSANFGDLYFRTDGTRWRNISSPSPGTTWGNETLSAVGSLIPYVFTTTGNTSDKWLGAYVPSTTSNTVPLMIPQAVDLKGVLFSNEDDDVDTDLEVYKNGVLVHTELVRNKRTYYNVGISGVSFIQGNRISVFLKKFAGGTGDQTAQNPIVTLLVKTTGESSNSGGTQYGV